MTATATHANCKPTRFFHIGCACRCSHSRLCGMKTFACDECSERVDTKPMLEAHKRNAHEKRAKRHYCHCGLSYENKSNLRRHERETHERHAPAVCNQCGKSYPRKTRYVCEGQKR